MGVYHGFVERRMREISPASPVVTIRENGTAELSVCKVVLSGEVHTRVTSPDRVEVFPGEINFIEAMKLFEEAA